MCPTPPCACQLLQQPTSRCALPNQCRVLYLPFLWQLWELKLLHGLASFHHCVYEYQQTPNPEWITSTSNPSDPQSFTELHEFFFSLIESSIVLQLFDDCLCRHTSRSKTACLTTTTAPTPSFATLVSSVLLIAAYGCMH